MKAYLGGVAVLAVFCLGASLAHADDDTYDTRSLAMGGTGVTTSNARNAPFKNPAMLAAKPHDTMALEIPIISLRVQDPNGVYSDLTQAQQNATDLSNAAQNFSNAMAGGNQATIQAAAQALITPLNNFNTSLQGISDKPLLVNAFVGAMLDTPSKSHGMALVVDEHANVGARFSYAAADQALVSTLTTDLAQCAAGTSSSCTAANSYTSSNGSITGLQSQFQLRAARLKEVGLSYAHLFAGKGGDGLAVGIMPKIQQIHTYDYSIGAQQGTSISLSQGENSYSSLNMDAGIAKTYARKDGNKVMFGLAVRDLVPRSFTTVLGDHIDIKPKATVGASYQTELTTVGLDVDVIPNRPMINGFSQESQYVRLGAEFDAWRWAQFRVGLRHDLKGNYADLPSVGLGFALFGVVHADLSAAYASKKEAAVSFQAGVNF